MDAQGIDIDRLVDYRSEYWAYIKKPHVSGKNLTGLCPFHDDKNNSFSVDLETGKWHCLAEGIGGNFLTFYAKIHGLGEGKEGTAQAYKEILEKYGVELDKASGKGEEKPALGGYSLAQYAFEKHLPEDWLRNECKASNAHDRYNGADYVKIPYMDENGVEVASRKRFANKEFRWKKGTSAKANLYGEWQMQKIRAAGYVILVEGESDSQSLWYMELSALGVPGASMFRAACAALLQGLKVYIHQEKDGGGETFFRKVAEGLKAYGFTGEVYRFSCGQIPECKDPSDVFIKFGKEGGSKEILELVGNAEKVDLSAPAPAASLEGAPVNLRQPGGWEYSEAGIKKYNKRSNANELICRTPVILKQRLKSLDTGEEKIEIAFKRDGGWHQAIFQRSTLFTSRGIVALSDLGCTVTSENARQVVQFLSALESENIDLIPKADATSTFGWQPGGRFIPGRGQGIVLDVDPSQQGAAAAYRKEGTLDGWVETMRPHRGRDKFRFILAASFAAPLLKIIKQRTFFVYNWGNSKAGKAQPLDTRIITPHGSTEMGRLKIGDDVIGGDGRPHKVTGIYPQGEKAVYKVSFSDGTSTRCCKEHLWVVSTQTRRGHKRGYKVMELSEMLSMPIKNGNGYNFHIPVCEAVEYAESPQLKIDAYLLGLLLGDGCTSLWKNRLFFNNSEADVIQRLFEKIRGTGGSVRPNPYSTNQFEISGVPLLKQAIRDYRLNVTSEKKFIPRDYLLAGIKERRELLAGLMDTDGSVDKSSGQFRYSTTSRQLAQNLQELCRSLGYRTKAKVSRHKGKGDEIVISIRTDDLIFKSEKHRSRVPEFKRKENKKAISVTGIEFIGYEKCQCIMVDSDEHTYLCDDFIVTHNTAALKAALSAWGDPERLMVNFNATQVGLERTAALYRDLPLGIDERQLSGGRQEDLERVVYMIANGKGKVRGAKSGGVQKTYSWRTVAIATGEEPLARETSKGGVSTRALELYGGPFEDERSASEMHQRSPENCGHAGPEFVNRIVKFTEESICGWYSRMQQYVSSISDGKSGSHVAGVAAVALADALVDEWLFLGKGAPDSDTLAIGRGSWERAMDMAKAVMEELEAEGPGDVNGHAAQFVADWILSNRSMFGDDAKGPYLGFLEKGGREAYIIPSMLRNALEKEGFSYRKAMAYLAQKGLIAYSKHEGHGGNRYAVNKKKDGQVRRFVNFHAWKLYEGEGTAACSQMELGEFMGVPDGTQLPFG